MNRGALKPWPAGLIEGKMGPMDAVAALNEIAFWLERELAPTFKVQAFRKAAGVVAGLDPDELAQRARTGRLKSMKGIGDSTFEVIRQAVDGGVPDYLLKVRATLGGTSRRRRRELHQALRGDLHSHSDWSDGGSPTGRHGRRRTLARPRISGPDRPLAEPQDCQRPERRASDRAARRCGRRSTPQPAASGSWPASRWTSWKTATLDQSPEMLDRLDIVVASVHSKLRSDRGTMTRPDARRHQ